MSFSLRTIERALSRLGYSRCKACKKPFNTWENQKQEKIYGEDHWQKPVEFRKKHTYSDECIFDTSKRGSTWVTRLPHEWYHDDCLQHTFHRGRGSVHVWGAISQNWKSPLIFLCGTGKKGVTAKDYQEQVLEPVVSPAFLGLYDYTASPDSQYIEDQAPCHGTWRALV